LKKKPPEWTGKRPQTGVHWRLLNLRSPNARGGKEEALPMNLAKQTFREVRSENNCQKKQASLLVLTT